MSEDMFDEWGEWAEETLMKGISEIKEEKKKLKEAINKIKETSFYKEYIDKMYVCKEDSDRIIFSTKKEYDLQSENNFFNELGEDFPYILFDICYTEYFKDGTPSLRLKEI